MPMHLANLLQQPIDRPLRNFTLFTHIQSEIGGWLTQLKTLELGEATEQLLTTLIELRQMKLPEQRRFELLQAIRDALQHLIRVLEQHYLGYALIDPARDQQLRDLIIRLQAEQAVIFHQIVESRQQKLSDNTFSLLDIVAKRKTRELMLESAFWAMASYADLVYLLVLTESRIPEMFWRKVYQLYYSMNALDAADMVWGRPGQPVTTVSQAFRSIILFSITTSKPTKPYHIRAIYQCVPYWLPLMKIGTDSDDMASYQVNLDSEAPPQFLARGQAADPHSLQVNISPLIDYIDSTLIQSTEHFHPIESGLLTESLKHYLISVLTDQPVRVHPREQVHGQVQLAPGISAAHYFLSSAKHFKHSLQLEGEAQLQKQSTNLPPRLGHETTRNITHSLEQQFMNEISRVYLAELVDRSKGGYGLKWHQTPIRFLRDGEFVIVRDQQRWLGALIRWNKPCPDHSIDLGVEVVGDSLCAMAVSAHRMQKTQPVYNPCIYFIDKYQQPCLVLPSPALFSDDQNLILRFGQQEIKIYLKQGQATNQNCAIFQFELLELSRKPTLDRYIQERVAALASQDLWETLK